MRFGQDFTFTEQDLFIFKEEEKKDKATNVRPEIGQVYWYGKKKKKKKCAERRDYIHVLAKVLHRRSVVIHAGFTSPLNSRTSTLRPLPPFSSTLPPPSYTHTSPRACRVTFASVCVGLLSDEMSDE